MFLANFVVTAPIQAHSAEERKTYFADHYFFNCICPACASGDDGGYKVSGLIL
jgi:hypothetical protein